MSKFRLPETKSQVLANLKERCTCILGSHLTEKIILGKVAKIARLCLLIVSTNMDWSP